MIALIIINSLIIWGVFTSLQENMIFAKIGNWIRGSKIVSYHGKKDYVEKDNLPSWIKKPLATCPICMSSVYGTSVFWFAYLTNYIDYDFIIIFYICYIFAIAGLNYLILSFMPEGVSDEVEYKELHIDESKSNIERQLNVYASNGWKINHILSEKEIGGALCITYLMERNK